MRHGILIVILLTATYTGACAPDSGSEPLVDVDLPDPLDGLLRLNHLQVKGTHNSFHLPPEELIVPNWDYAHAPLDVQLEEQDVRQVEIDVHWHPEDEGFRVYHVPLLDARSTCDTFVECLGILKDWSDEHPEHMPLFILVEPKDDVDPHPITGHYDALDAEILAVWPEERLITPDAVRGDHADLRTALAAEGWPLLRDCRGKALFQMLDSEDHRAAYLAPDPTLAGRPMFVRGGPEEPWGAIVEIGNALGREDEIRGLVAQGYIVRSTADDTDPEDMDLNPARAGAALDAGSHLISTDYPTPIEGGYWFGLPGGGPVRCNPVSAPPECVDDALE